MTTLHREWGVGDAWPRRYPGEIEYSPEAPAAASFGNPTATFARPACRSDGSAALEQAVTEVIVEVGDGVDLPAGDLGGIRDAAETDHHVVTRSAALDDHVTGPGITVARLPPGVTTRVPTKPSSLQSRVVPDAK